MRAFRQGLKDSGYVDGENVAIEYRWAENQAERLPALAAELVRRQVAVIATRSAGVFAAKAATSTIPIVFMLSEDPVRLDLVKSLARPGGNLTGVNFFRPNWPESGWSSYANWCPEQRVWPYLSIRPMQCAEATVKDVQAAAGAMGLQIQVIRASISSEINAAFATFAREPPDALFVGTDPFFSSRRIQLILLTTRYGLPTTYSGRHYPEIGGLMSYGSNAADASRQVGVYVGRILKGAKPADLPVVQSSKFELVINAETARLLGFTVPPSLLAIADEVIE